MVDLGHHTCVADPLEPLLIITALLYGRDHKGMPNWPVIVGRIGILLADPAHLAWGEDGRGTRALAEMPQETPPPEGLTAALLSALPALPVTVLEWLSHHLLCCAGPPYDLRWEPYDLPWDQQPCTIWRYYRVFCIDVAACQRRRPSRQASQARR